MIGFAAAIKEGSGLEQLGRPLPAAVGNIDLQFVIFGGEFTADQANNGQGFR